MGCKSQCTNLKEETIRVLSDNELTPDDVLWVGGVDFTIPVETFWSLAEECNYDFGFGDQIVANDLTIVCDGGWLIRKGCEGCEWWKFVRLPKKPSEERNVEWLTIDVEQYGGSCTDGKSLLEINSGSTSDDAEG